MGGNWYRSATILGGLLALAPFRLFIGLQKRRAQFLAQARDGSPAAL
jgi:hypothetical protein